MVWVEQLQRTNSAEGDIIWEERHGLYLGGRLNIHLMHNSNSNWYISIFMVASVKSFLKVQFFQMYGSILLHISGNFPWKTIQTSLEFINTISILTRTPTLQSVLFTFSHFYVHFTGHWTNK